MMTSILLIDVQGLEARVGGGLSPADLLAELTHTMHGMSRQIMVQRAYCSSRISTYRRNAYRDAGYQIVETAGPDETLIMMTLDLADLSGGNAVYEEAILLGGTADYTALARLAHENLMMISVMDHPTIPTSLEALADGLIDPADLPVSDTPSILDRSEGKREETTPRKSPFLAPLPKSSPAPAAAAAPVAEAAKAETAKPDPKLEPKADDAVLTDADGGSEKSSAPKTDAKKTDTDKAAADKTDTDKTDPELKSDTETKEKAAKTPAQETADDQDAALADDTKLADPEKNGETENSSDPEKSGDAEKSGDTEKSGDPWPDQKTGEILVAGGSTADTVTTTLDDSKNGPKDEQKAEPSAAKAEDTAPADTSKPVDPIEAELAGEMDQELSVSAEDIGTDANEPPGTILIDLQIEDLVAEEFTETPADPVPAPSVAPADASMADASVADDPASGDDPLDALFADIGTDLAPAAPETVSQTAPVDRLDSLDIAPEELLEDLVPREPVVLEETANGSSETPAPKQETAKEAKKPSSEELSEEVDELLSRLMSDGPSGTPTEDVKLDVVPER